MLSRPVAVAVAVALVSGVGVSAGASGFFLLEPHILKLELLFCCEILEIGLWPVSLWRGTCSGCPRAWIISDLEGVT